MSRTAGVASKTVLSPGKLLAGEQVSALARQKILGGEGRAAKI